LDVTTTASSGDVAVVIPIYNRADLVAEAVQSALAQGPMVREILVVDDGSTDGTSERVRQIDEPRVQLISQPNRGPAAARNTGWRATTADWIMFLDSDDTLAPGAIDALLMAARQGNGLVIPYGREEIFGPEFTSQAVSTAYMSQRTGSVLADIVVNFRGTIFCALFPRVCIEAVGGFDERIVYFDEYDFALRVARRFHFVHADAPVYRARMHGGNRHRGFPTSSCHEHMETLQRFFADETALAMRILRRRAMAHCHWVMGKSLQADGQSVASRKAFLAAARIWPFKLDAWRQVLFN